MLLFIILASLWMLQLNLPVAVAKCCPANGALCGDKSESTPCCGYLSCNFWCCHCKGTTVADQVVTTCGTRTTAYITAPPGTTWTCRDNHFTSSGTCPPKRDLAEPTTTIDTSDEVPVSTILRLPRPTSLSSYKHPAYSSDELTSLKSKFEHVRGGRKHNGVEVIDMDDAFGFFNVAAGMRGTLFGNAVKAKFRAHDIDGDGFLTFDESLLECDASGCE